MDYTNQCIFQTYSFNMVLLNRFLEFPKQYFTKKKYGVYMEVIVILANNLPCILTYSFTARCVATGMNDGQKLNPNSDLYNWLSYKH